MSTEFMHVVSSASNEIVNSLISDQHTVLLWWFFLSASVMFMVFLNWLFFR